MVFFCFFVVAYLLLIALASSSSKQTEHCAAEEGERVEKWVVFTPRQRHCIGGQ